MAITRQAQGRAYTGGKYNLEFDPGHQNQGWIKDVNGGAATADVVSEKMGADHITRKHLATVKYEEIDFKCGTGMTTGFYDWINSAFNHTNNDVGRRDGAIIHYDYDYNEISRLNFTQGLITEFGMPALDASSKDAALMSLKFKPETTRKLFNLSGKKTTSNTNAAVQKKWLPSNFRLRFTDTAFEQALMKVNKIEALVVKQKVVENAVGEQRDYQQEPASVEIPNLVITLAESHADEFYRWHESFVIKGINGQDQEKQGILEYLTPDLTTVLFTVSFENLGIFKVTPDKVEAGAESIRRVKVEMYCEDLKFNYTSSAVWR
jgi:phage tail-like protein